MSNRIDLSDHRVEDGITLLSPPQSFPGGEEDYDTHIGGALGADLMRSGRGAWRLASYHCTRPIKVLLEIGAGGGTCSLGLLSAAADAALLITDTSPAFLRLIKRKITTAGLDGARAQFATLAGEDLAKLPQGAFDAIVIASAVHHVGDWRRFLREAAAALSPGGVLVMQEPCREGNLMMAMVLDVALSDFWPKPSPLPPADVAKLSACRDSIYLLADSTIEKIGEDKHSFLTNQVFDAARRGGFTGGVFYSNQHFADLTERDLVETTSPCSFLQYLDSFLENHHRISPEGMTLLRQRLFPMFQGLDRTFRNGDGAPLMGSFVLKT